MEYCKECFTPSTRPRIQFLEGICNACWHAKNRKNNKFLTYTYFTDVQHVESNGICI